MEKFLIEGGNRLSGSVTISGANAAVAILPAAIMCDEGICKIDNLPQIEDIQCLERILKDIGAGIEKENNSCISINSSSINSYVADGDDVKK